MLRRRLLQYLASSPVLAGAEDFVPSKPEEAQNVLDFEAAARRALPPAHYGYLATGVEDDRTLRANREAFGRYYLRPRRLVDVTKVDSSIELFGRRWPGPVLLAPTGSGNAFHPQSELHVARAARKRQTAMVLSTAATESVEKVSETYGEPVWYQLYPTSSWEVTKGLVRRAEKAGCPVLVVTVDVPAGRKTETQQRWARLDQRPCQACHADAVKEGGGLGVASYFRRKPMFAGLNMDGVTLFQPALTWEMIRRIRDLSSMKLVLKGIVTREDAELCRENGVNGLIVSNHGGRAEESGVGTLDVLTEVVAGAGSGMPVLIDGGFRRGADVLKALALGARAVAIGRPYLWGVSAFGQPGVEAVLALFQAELELVMKQCGARTVAEISRQMVGRQA